MRTNVARALANFDVILPSRRGDYLVRFGPIARLRAIELLGKSLGMLVDKVELALGRSVVYSRDFGDVESGARGE